MRYKSVQYDGSFITTIIFLLTDWKKHAASPCVQIRKVIDKYDMITDGLAALHGSSTDVREGYQATKRTMQQGVDSLKNDIDLTGTERIVI